MSILATNVTLNNTVTELRLLEWFCYQIYHGH
jgi:hypothetical protein